MFSITWAHKSGTELDDKLPETENITDKIFNRQLSVRNAKRTDRNRG